MRYFSFAFSVLLFTGCYQPNFQYTNNKLILKKEQNNIVDINLTNGVKIPRFNNCVFDGYTIDDDNIHIEYIDLKSQCSWNGLASGYYKDFLSSNIKELKSVDRYENDKYEVVLYETDNKFFYLISSYDVSMDVFILDYTGEIASKINTEFGLIAKEYQESKKFDKSMIDNDIIEHYFSKESGRSIIWVF